MSRLLRSTLLALIVSGIGLAYADGNSLTCSVALPPYSKCFIERTGWTVWGLEGAYGVEVTLDPRSTEILSVAPYAILGYYASEYAWWVEARTPRLGIPVIGTTDYLRAGFTLRW